MKLPAAVARRPRLRRVLATAATLVAGFGVVLSTAQPAQAVTPAGIAGVDVSHYQGSINWGSVKGAGVAWAYIKATEGTTYTDPQFGTNYTGAYNAGVIRGAYHFAKPGSSSGAAQATYFAAHGGAWSADNRTLPGALDLEAGCSGLSQAAMVSWIRDFSNTYKAKTGRDVVLYTTASWWSSCTGANTGFGSTNPLWVANWGVSSPAKPAGWGAYTFWQWTDAASVAGISGNVDGDVFNGSADRLLALANNTA
ncbi:MAG: GH25 family lysozyme [Actinocatenispora sp.]